MKTELQWYNYGIDNCCNPGTTADFLEYCRRTVLKLLFSLPRENRIITDCNYYCGKYSQSYKNPIRSLTSPII